MDYPTKRTMLNVIRAYLNPLGRKEAYAEIDPRGNIKLHGCSPWSLLQPIRELVEGQGYHISPADDDNYWVIPGKAPRP